ncbi:SixA phosphatase family protein [Olivibacter domesticus]|uniref:Phosphohistidine phosphatase n=1 Tax=Olivibacter domesticus TaxID=407022 RepID=A0A1H7LP91_OLID1|nr:histidine phosphatase family protein [Olivibacter domesticus]SEL00558.1 phosphohistidine phosphatase [Olivibacter domesticus]
MAKHLFLIRHAKSDWNFDLPDFERPLNSRGQKNAPYMAKKLAEHEVQPQLLVSSPANRALSTAQLFQEELTEQHLQIKEESAIYEASTPTLLKIINGFDNRYSSIALFGHNPGLSNLAHYLSSAFEYDMPTCSIVHIQFGTDDWAEISEDAGAIVWFNYPKLA